MGERPEKKKENKTWLRELSKTKSFLIQKAENGTGSQVYHLVIYEPGEGAPTCLINNSIPVLSKIKQKKKGS